MAVVTFYRQKRQDGGLRTGIEVSGHLAFQRFDRGRADSDPALLWYVDVQCSGNSIPADPERAREWLVENELAITGHILSLADDVPAGIDPGDWPLRRDFKLGRSVKGMISCSAVRRAAAKNIADVLRDIADHWLEHIEELSAYQPQ